MGAADGRGCIDELGRREFVKYYDMKNHFDLSDKNFVASFSNGSLDPKLFSHEAHLRLAWLHINAEGLEPALVNIPQQIQNYVSALGASDKYHHTLTIAAIRTVNHFKLKSKSDNFIDFIAEFPRLKSHFKELIAQHYSIDIFTLEKAKRDYLEPDLLSFD